MPSFFVPLSGLDADNTALNTIANNLANMNTVGYKSQSVQFSDLFYQQVGENGAGDAEQVGAGTQVGAISTDFTAGTPNPVSGVAQDVALTGDGFFVVQNNGVQEYTRAGNFVLGSDGHLITQGGQNVMGYPAVNGAIDTGAALTGIQIPVGQVEQPQATTSMNMTGNLNSAAVNAATSNISFSGNLDPTTAVGGTVTEPVTMYDASGTKYNATITFTNNGGGQWGYSVTAPGVTGGAAASGTLNFAADGSLTTPAGSQSITMNPTNGDAAFTFAWNPSSLTQATGTTALGTVTADGSASSVSEPITIYDSMGQSHTATVTFTKGATANTWNYNISLPSSDYSGTPLNNTGSLTFDANGSLVSPTTVNGITFPGLSDGASNLTFNWNLTGANGQPTISQVAAASSFTGTNQNGFASGQYEGFSVSSNGVVSASFDNGQTKVLGQLAVASITNEQGLVRLGDNNYQTTLASGQASIGTAGTGGRGNIQDQALEGSNVDISTEFSNLIVAQRAFEANSKAITTFDTVTQETINMIH